MVIYSAVCFLMFSFSDITGLSSAVNLRVVVLLHCLLNNILPNAGRDFHHVTFKLIYFVLWTFFFLPCFNYPVHASA